VLRPSEIYFTQLDNVSGQRLTERLLQMASEGSGAVGYSNLGSEANECAALQGPAA
jgi:adenosylmethionine-8-amino-7-oxononanoate aminotransferase